MYLRRVTQYTPRHNIHRSRLLLTGLRSEWIYKQPVAEIIPYDSDVDKITVSGDDIRQWFSAIETIHSDFNRKTNNDNNSYGNKLNNK